MCLFFALYKELADRYTATVVLRPVVNIYHVNHCYDTYLSKQSSCKLAFKFCYFKILCLIFACILNSELETGPHLFD